MKRVFSILFALVLLIALAAPVLAAEAPLLYDGADLLSEEQERDLLPWLEEISDAYGVDVVVAAVDSTEGYGADRYVELWYDEYGYGRGSDRDGVLLLVAMAEREYRILSNGFAARAITSGDIDRIAESIAEELSAGEFAEAFLEFAWHCEYELGSEDRNQSFQLGQNLLISLAIGLVAAAIVTGILCGQLKSVRSRRGAEEYARPGSMHLTRSGDLFLYRTVDRRRRPQQSSSHAGRSGGGGSRNVGGGRF